MKRTWKNFRLDKNKVYMRIGQAVVYLGFNFMVAGFGYFAFLQGMTY